MTLLSPIRPARVASLLSALVLFALPAHAQGLGGLIKKKIDKATTKAPEQQAADAPPVFDKVTLEITPARVEKLTAARRAAKKFADGLEGPSAIEKKIAPLDDRQTAIYSKQVEAINAWDQKRRDYENCVDSALGAIRNRAESQRRSEAMSDPATLRKMMELGQAMAAAQQKGDTATVRKIVEEMNQKNAPTKVDSAEAARQCPKSTPPALVKEWLGLKQQLDTLRAQLQRSEDSVRAIVGAGSGMTTQQSAVFCERIKAYAARLKNKQKQTGFTDAELKTLANLEQAVKDLDALCP